MNLINHLYKNKKRYKNESVSDSNWNIDFSINIQILSEYRVFKPTSHDFIWYINTPENVEKISQFQSWTVKLIKISSTSQCDDNRSLPNRRFHFVDLALLLDFSDEHFFQPEIFRAGSFHKSLMSAPILKATLIFYSHYGNRRNGI